MKKEQKESKASEEQTSGELSKKLNELKFEMDEIKSELKSEMNQMRGELGPVLESDAEPGGKKLCSSEPGKTRISRQDQNRDKSA